MVAAHISAATLDLGAAGLMGATVVLGALGVSGAALFLVAILPWVSEVLLVSQVLQVPLV